MTKLTAGLCVLCLSVSILSGEETKRPESSARQPVLKEKQQKNETNIPADRKKNLSPQSRSVKKGLAFRETPLEDAVELLREITNINIVVDPDVYKQNPPPISLSLKNVKVKVALDWICKLADVKYKLMDNAVYITTNEKCPGKTITRIYDLSPFLVKIKDFPAPKMDLTSVGKNNGGGIEIMDFGDQHEDEGLDKDDIVEKIKATIQPDSWGQKGIHIGLLQNSLIVTHTRDAHLEIIKLLMQL